MYVPEDDCCDGKPSEWSLRDTYGDVEWKGAVSPKAKQAILE